MSTAGETNKPCSHDTKDVSIAIIMSGLYLLLLLHVALGALLSPTLDQLQGALKLFDHIGVPISAVNIIYASEGQRLALLRLLRLRGERDLFGARSLSASSINHFCQQQQIEEEEKEFRGGQSLDFILPSPEIAGNSCFSAAAARSEFGRKMILFLAEEEEKGLDLIFDGVGTVNTGVFLLGGGGKRLSEAYKVHSEAERIIVKELALIRDNGTATWLTPHHFIWDRRSQLHGHTFKAITGTWAPFIESYSVTDNATFIPKGLYVDIMDTLQRRLNFSVVTLYHHEDSWRELLSFVSNRTVDLGLTGFSQTYERSMLVDFSLPFASSAIRLLFARDGERSPMYIYVGSFLKETWIGIFTAVITFAVVLATITLARFYTVGDGGTDDPGRSCSDALELSLAQSVIFVMFAQIGRRFPKEPNSGAIRMAFVSISFGGFIVISLYRAMLGASLAVKIHHPLVRSLDDLLDSPYPVLVKNNTSVYNYFKSALPGTVQHRLFKEKIEVSVYDRKEKEGMEAIAKGEFPNAVLIGVYQPLSTRAEYPCQVTSLPVNYRQVGNGFVYQKGWPYTKLLNYHFLKIQEEGITNQLTTNWIRVRDLATCALDSEGGHAQAELEHVATLFALWACGVTVSLAVCLLEVAKRGSLKLGRTEEEDNQIC